MTSTQRLNLPPPLIIFPPSDSALDPPSRTNSVTSLGTTAGTITTAPSTPPETPCTLDSRRPRAGRAPGHVQSVSKRKSMSFLGKLSLKEPSRQALEQYERDLNRKAADTAAKMSRTNGANLKGTSMAKLPPSVPKVNSKWDGLPKAISEQKRGKGRGREAVGKEHWRSSLRNSTGLGPIDQMSLRTFDSQSSGKHSRGSSQVSRDDVELRGGLGSTPSFQEQAMPQHGSSKGTCHAASSSSLPGSRSLVSLPEVRFAEARSTDDRDRGENRMTSQGPRLQSVLKKDPRRAETMGRPVREGSLSPSMSSRAKSTTSLLDLGESREAQWGGQEAEEAKEAATERPVLQTHQVANDAPSATRPSNPLSSPTGTETEPMEPCGSPNVNLIQSTSQSHRESPLVLGGSHADSTTARDRLVSPWNFQKQPERPRDDPVPASAWKSFLRRAKVTRSARNDQTS